MGVIAAAIAVQVFYPDLLAGDPKDPQKDNPVAIATDAATTAPWGEVFGAIFEGVLDLAGWAATFIVRALNWGMTIIRGEPVLLGPVFGFMIIGLLVLWRVWGKKEKYYSRITSLLLAAGAIILVVFSAGILLAYLGML